MSPAARRYPSATARARYRRLAALRNAGVMAAVGIGIPLAVVLVSRHTPIPSAPTWLLWLSIAWVVVFAFLTWLEVADIRRLPPIAATPLQATIVGRESYETGSGELRSGAWVFAVDVTGGGESFESRLADLPAISEWPRFDEGSVWEVHRFTGTTERVLLTARHDDVLRDGYDLAGLRLQSGRFAAGRAGYGSDLIARGFRDRL